MTIESRFTDQARPRVRPLRHGAALGLATEAWWQRAAVLAAALALALGLLYLLWLLARPLSLLLAAIVLAEALSPVAAWLSRWLPRTLAIVLVYLLLLVLVGLLGWLIVPPLVVQAQGLVLAMPGFIEQAGTWLDTQTPFDSDAVASMLIARLQQVAFSLVTLPLTIVTTVTDILLVLVISVYWLIGTPALLRFVLSLVADDRRAHVESVLREMGNAMGGYVRGVAINALIVATLSYFGLLLIGVPYALVLAIVAGLGEVIPIVGPLLVSIPAVLVALLVSPFKALLVAAYYLMLQQFEGNVLMPKVMAAQTDVPPVLGLFALVVGGYLGGILGALIALPVAAAVKVIVVRVLAPTIRRWTGAEPGLAMPAPPQAYDDEVDGGEATPAQGEIDQAAEPAPGQRDYPTGHVP